MRRPWFWALLAFIVVILLAGVASSLLTYQRVARLSDLKSQMDETLTKMSQLVTETYYMLYDSDDIRTSRERWNGSLSSAIMDLGRLARHPGLEFLDTSIAGEVDQIRNAWNGATQNYFSSDEFLISFLDSDIEISTYDNISSMLSQIAEISPGAEFSSDDQMDIYQLNLASSRLKTGNVQLRVFITSGVEALRQNVQDESNKALNHTLIVSGVVLVSLILLIILVLVFSLRILRRANINLEEQVAGRTRSIQNLLDFSGVGYITFGPDMTVNPEISRECETIFGRSIAGDNIAQLLFSEPQAQQDFADAMDLVFTGTSQPDVVFDVLEPKTVIGEKTIAMSFRLVDGATIMGQLQDISENEALQRTIAKENTQREMVLKAVTAKRYFLSILDEAKDLFAALEACIVDGNFHADEETNHRIVREVHTFKANASFLRMSRTSKLAHALEEVLIAQGILGDDEPLGNEIAEMKSAFSDEVASVVDILGREWLEGADKIEVSLDLLENTSTLIKNRYPDDEELIHAVDQLSYLPLSNLFIRLGDMSRDLAATNGKKVNVHIEDNSISVTPHQYHHLSNSVNHILRNMITHGVEFPRHREKAGKSPEGSIRIHSTLADGGIRIVISDDGAGLSLQKISERAKSLGWLKDGASLSTKDIVKMIFQPGFSTADMVTAVAGRGFGLSAVKESIYEIGGKIKVSTARGRGTSFIIVIPEKRMSN